jgi:phage FluMu protein Com
MRFFDIRCDAPAGGFKTGRCHGLLFRINNDGDLEVKCHRCHRVQLIAAERLSRFRRVEAFST